MIALAVIIVRNAIMPIVFIRQPMNEGMSLKGAVAQVCAVRIKSIALTAVSATVGAYVIVDDPIFNGLAISSVFGLAVFTLLAVVVAFIVLCGAFAILCDSTAAMAQRRWT
jgi:multidrug efflux pump subunit AcrB